jgi:hypothetical protein
MIKIVTINSELKSAKTMGFLTFTEDFKSVNEFDNDVVVRWGNSWTFHNNDGEVQEFKNLINKSSAIRANCVKHTALKTLGSVVKVPQIFTSIVPEGKTAVIRPFEHTAGSNFKVVKGPYRIQRGEYATEFLKTSLEYRVWFAGDMAIAATRVALEVLGNNPDEEFPCRSNWGYRVASLSRELYEQVMKAAKASDLQCGAADVLYFNKEYYFMELNSAPTIDTKRIRTFFIENINRLANKFNLK